MNANRKYRFILKPNSLVAVTVGLLFFRSIAGSASESQRHLGQPGFVQEVRIQLLGDTNSAMAGVEVALMSSGSPDARAITDASGTARLTEVAAGEYTLVINAAEKELYRDQFEIKSNDSAGSSVVHVLVPIKTVNSNAASRISLNELKAPKKAQVEYAAAIARVWGHEYEMALQTLDQTLTIYPQYAKAHNARGVVLGLMDRPRDSEISFRAAIQHDQSFAEPHFNLGKLLLESDRAKEARDELQKAVSLKSSLPAIELLIDAMLRIHEETSAVSIVRSLHTRGLEHPAEFHLEIARELERHGMSDMAIQQYTLSFQDHPSELERRDAEGALSRSRNNK